jgi:hypothetical protein
MKSTVVIEVVAGTGTDQDRVLCTLENGQVVFNEYQQNIPIELCRFFARACRLTCQRAVLHLEQPAANHPETPES